jgi:CDI immunity proteins
MSKNQNVRRLGSRRRKPAATVVRPRGTLNEASGWKAASPDSAPTGLVRRALTLLDAPITEFSAADIGFLLRQRIGVEILLDRALDLLECDPIVETEYYPGDLLCAVLRVPPQHFAANDMRQARIAAIGDKACAAAAAANESGQPHLSKQIRAEIDEGVKQLGTLLKFDKKN